MDQTEVSRGEVLRYMGCKGAQSEAVMALVEDCLAQLGQACEPRHLTAVFPLSLSADGGMRTGAVFAPTAGICPGTWRTATKSLYLQPPWAPGRIT